MKTKTIFVYFLALLSVFLFCSASLTMQKTIYLTFDDGPSASITPQILDILSHHRVKATFFVIGKNVEKNPDILKKIFKDGHSVGVHSYSHDYKKIYKDETSLIDDINKCVSTINKIMPSYSPSLYRFPGGSFGLNDKFINTIKNLGYRYFDWNATNGDCELKADENPSKDFAAYAINTGANRNIIVLLMHDAAGKKATVESLNDIIDYYKKNGYVFKTLDEF